MPAARDNAGKPELARVFDFDHALDELVGVMTTGALKYGDGNWLAGGKPDSEYLDAAARHIRRHRNGELRDSESGHMHLAHAAWNLLALMRLNYGPTPQPVPRSGDQVIFYPDSPVAVEPGQRRVTPAGLVYTTIVYRPGTGWDVLTEHGITYEGWSGHGIATDVLLGRAD